MQAVSGSHLVLSPVSIAGPLYICPSFLEYILCTGPNQNSCYGIYATYFDFFQYKWQIGCVDMLVFSSQPTELPKILAQERPKSNGVTTVFNDYDLCYYNRFCILLSYFQKKKQFWFWAFMTQKMLMVSAGRMILKNVFLPYWKDFLQKFWK